MRETTNEWDTEPSRVEWKDEATGYACLLVRNESMGNLCGYVAVPPGHPAHGKPYDDVEVSVHGGLTYAHACQGDICHAPEPGEPDNVYWFGFDCAHAYDLMPLMAERERERGWPAMGEPGVYRNVAYVQAECASLARQLKELA